MADSRCVCRAHLDPQRSRLRAGPDVTAAQWSWAAASGPPRHVVVAPGGRLLVDPPGDAPSSAVRGRPTALPAADKSVGTLVVPLLLPVVQEDLDGLFPERHRVLSARGLLTVLVPQHPSFGIHGRRLAREVRRYRPHRAAIGHPDRPVTAADLAVVGDERLGFTVDTGADPIPRAVDRLCAAGLHPRALPPEVRLRVTAHHARGEPRPA